VITVRIDGTTYELASVNDALASLTGDESLLIEEYLGGFDQIGVKATRTAIVMAWLTLRAAGHPMSLEEIQTIPGLTFGDVIQATDEGEPEDPMTDPGRPLPTMNGSNGSSDGVDVSGVSPATSDKSGDPA
jgi:hypothetical protein